MNRRMGVAEDIRVETRQDVRVGFRKVKMRRAVRSAMERVMQKVMVRMCMRGRGW
jgi:hypothetical protein